MSYSEADAMWGSMGTILQPSSSNVLGDGTSAAKSHRFVEFVAERTLRDFWISQDFYQFVVGPFGSTKTTNCIMKLLAYAALQSRGADGKRRTRFAIARPTLRQIKMTVLQDIFTWLRPIVRYKVSDEMLELRVGDIASDWYLIPLENIEDQRRLLSMQLSGVYLNEFREIPLELMTAAAGRVDRYPRKSDGGCTNPFVMGDSNPPPEGGEWHKFLTEDPPTDEDSGKSLLTFVHQPSGMSPKAAWRSHLSEDYYARLARGHDPDWVNTHVHSMWAPDMSGQAVFRKSFAPGFHLRSGLQVQPRAALLLGADWGRTPACLFAQEDARGRLLILREVVDEGTNVELFASTRIKPVLSEGDFFGLRHFLTGDPSGMAKSDRTEESVFDVLERVGISAVPAPTNDIEPRLRAVESRLSHSPGGEPGILIDPEGCPLLVKALKREYKYRRRKTGDIEDKPDKTHPWSDLADALQYLCLGVETNAVERAVRRVDRRVERQRLRLGGGGGPGGNAAGWT